MTFKNFTIVFVAVIIAAVIITGIFLKATHPELYNVAHFLAILGVVTSVIVMPIIYIGFSSGREDVIKKIMGDENSRRQVMKANPIGWFRKGFSFIWAIFFLVLYASQGWYVVATLFVISFLFSQATIPHWNDTIRKVQSLITLNER